MKFQLVQLAGSTMVGVCLVNPSGTFSEPIMIEKDLESLQMALTNAARAVALQTPQLYIPISKMEVVEGPITVKQADKPVDPVVDSKITIPSVKPKIPSPPIKSKEKVNAKKVDNKK